MADITVIIAFLLALAAAPEFGRLLPPTAPRWVGRAWWRNNAFRPTETPPTETPPTETPPTETPPTETGRPRLCSSGDEQAAAEKPDGCAAGEDA
ncbi:hypothetical protein ACIBED_04635 [Rhodococcus coprophilus]|uniref:Uncharacterized protein n=1 Tax=Rhodococcus coprophilus TaxID=38310 RepID=A0A2X4UVT1_9NOCA|nr:hypothetical protein [Rhodococcus coprophilus]MBM7460445.1 hypothetical protein [Rhodococcus coprophilus]SQI39828.1 Uncharacterised protein [Rhodococcus coprophilus]